MLSFEGMKTPLTTAGRQAGFTLLELMVTVAVATILLAIAVPSFQDVIRRNRLAAATNDFLASIYYTRSEALKEDKRAIMCASSDGRTCTGSWHDGWIVVVDSNQDGVVNLDSTDKLVLVREASPSDITITGTSGDSEDASEVVSFAYMPTGRVESGKVSIEVKGYDANRKIVISPSGRPGLE